MLVLMGKGNRRSGRLLITTALAVLIPAAALAVLQYRALASLESETKIAVRESLRQTIRAYDQYIQERVGGVSRRALDALSDGDYDPNREDRLLATLGGIVSESDAIDQAAVAYFCECPGQFAAIVTAVDTWYQTGPDASRWPLRPLLQEAGVSEGPLNVPFYLHLEEGYGEDRFSRPPGLYAFQHAGSLVTSVRIPRSVLSTIVSDSIRNPPDDRPQLLGAPEFRLVRTETESPIVPLSSNGRYELSEALGAPLAKWALAAHFTGPSVEAIAHRNFLYNVALMVAVFAALICGVVLSLRAVARQARLAEMKSAFASNVSHEMRTPLSLISLYSESLELGRIGEPGRVHKYHRVIHRESRRLTQMVNNILDFSRMESGRRDYRMVPSSAEDVVEGILSGYREPIVAAGFDLEVDISTDLPPILADQNALSQAILNLLDNAVKYSPDRKQIAVRVAKRSGHVAIQVEDRGCGIPAGEQERIFDKFHRVGNPMTPVTRGSGLGLALAKHTVEAHGGRIEVESRPGGGSRFTILIPALETRAEADSGERVAVQSPGG